ncbi:MAG: ABC transporter ATP-binding protein [Halobacteria archaeon]|nr:ABC transporter ATP-binding protein [Halobacteria archaeon]
MDAIQTQDLTKRFGDLEALSRLTFNVEKGELFGFIGPNGAGKSTTINILTGQMKPSSGSSTVLGIDPIENPVEVRSKIGILPESQNPPSFLTPREYFEFVAEVRGIEDLESKVDEWVNRLRFEDKLDTLNIDLSRGQKQKVMITQAFLHEPELVFIDEPLSNLDPIIQEKVKDYFVKYHEEGNTVFLSTHLISVAEEICTRVGIINKGTLVAEKDVLALKEENKRLIQEFMREVEGVEPTQMDD